MAIAMEVVSLLRPSTLLSLVFVTSTLLACSSQAGHGAGLQKKRSRKHVDDILSQPSSSDWSGSGAQLIEKEVLKELESIYVEKIKPLEELTHFDDLKQTVMTINDIYARPIVLVTGPWSTGKTTLIKYLLGLEDDDPVPHLHISPEPTTSNFVVLTHGHEMKTTSGSLLAAQPASTRVFGATTADIQQFGRRFLEHLFNVNLPEPILRNLTLVDTPGILENRRQQDRGYPFNDAMRWLVQKADLVLVVFDPTKLDIGTELDFLFDQLKDKESLARIILNKADSIGEQELLRSYGALLWVLSPLINVTGPPRVYVGSFWTQKPYSNNELGRLMEREEKSLLRDLRGIIEKRVLIKIARMHIQASNVQKHYKTLTSFGQKYKELLAGGGKVDKSILAEQLVNEPQKFGLFAADQSDDDDLLDYDTFFRLNEFAQLFQDLDISSQSSSKRHRALVEKLDEAVRVDLPALTEKYKKVFRDQGKVKKEETTVDEADEEDQDSETYFTLSDLGRGYEKVADVDKVKRAGQMPKKSESSDDEEEEEVVVEKIVAKSFGSQKISKGKGDKVKPSLRKESAGKTPTSTKVKKTVRAAAVELEEDEDEAAPKPKLYRKSGAAKKTQGGGLKETVVKLAARQAAEIVTERLVQATAAANVKCRPYRKTCVPIGQDVITADRQVAQRAVHVSRPEGGKKCPIYRKSCQSDKEDVVEVKLTKEEKVVTAKKHVAPPSEVKMTTVVSHDKVAKKCPPYRKNCKSEEVQVATKKIDRRQDVVEAPSKTGSCLIYRKSCTPEAPKVDAAEQKQQKKVDQKVSTEKKAVKKLDDTGAKAKCPPYRKSCQPTSGEVLKRHVDEEAHHAPASKESAEGKCKPYQKSCKEPKLKEQVVKTVAEKVVKTAAETYVAKKLVDELAQATGVKCPPYRKTCQVASKEKVKHVVPPTLPADHIVVPVDGKCPPYRKSCQRPTAEPKSSSKEQLPAAAVVKKHHIVEDKSKKVDKKAEALLKDVKKLESTLHYQESLEDELYLEEYILAKKKAQQKAAAAAAEEESADDLSSRSRLRDSDDEEDQEQDAANVDASPERVVEMRKVYDTDSNNLQVDLGVGGGYDEKDIERLVKERISDEKLYMEKHVRAPTTSGAKCAPYRKSCERTTAADTAAHTTSSEDRPFFDKLQMIALSLWSTIGSTPSGDKRDADVDQGHCPPYRKSCGKVKVEKKELERPMTKVSVADDQSTKPPAASKKVAKKQQKQRGVEEPLIVVAPAAGLRTKAKEKKKLKESTTAKSETSEKCPRYRKSCVSDYDTSHKIVPLPRPPDFVGGQRHKDSFDVPPYTMEPGTKCPIYRKSCQVSPTLQSSTTAKAAGAGLPLDIDDDVVYILDQKTGLSKKYCKKKTANGLGCSSTTVGDLSKRRPEDESWFKRLLRYLCSGIDKY